MFIITALVSFASFMLLFSHVSSRAMRRLVGYKGVVDVVLHTSIICLFIGTSTLGLMQAEAAGILFSLYLRGYAWAAGYEKLQRGHWVRYAGRFS